MSILSRILSNCAPQRYRLYQENLRHAQIVAQHHNARLRNHTVATAEPEVTIPSHLPERVAAALQGDFERIARKGHRPNPALATAPNPIVITRKTHYDLWKEAGRQLARGMTEAAVHALHWSTENNLDAAVHHRADVIESLPDVAKQRFGYQNTAIAYPATRALDIEEAKHILEQGADFIKPKPPKDIGRHGQDQTDGAILQEIERSFGRYNGAKQAQYQAKLNKDLKIAKVQEEAARAVFFKPSLRTHIIAKLNQIQVTADAPAEQNLVNTYGKVPLRIIKDSAIPTTYGQVTLPEPVDSQKAHDFPFLADQFKKAWLASAGRPSHDLSAAKAAIKALAIDEADALYALEAEVGNAKITYPQLLTNGENLFYTHKIALSLAAAQRDQEGYVRALAKLHLVQERNKRLMARCAEHLFTLPQDQAQFAVAYLRAAAKPGGKLSDFAATEQKLVAACTRYVQQKAQEMDLRTLCTERDYAKAKSEQLEGTLDGLRNQKAALTPAELANPYCFNRQQLRILASVAYAQKAYWSVRATVLDQAIQTRHEQGETTVLSDTQKEEEAATFELLTEAGDAAQARRGR